ncbi:MAG: DUF4249 domain-containing protein [Bacteroidota bacterium]|nr:DUF4249 domain-containing protein [Bacteroidota bacterium]
MKQFINSLLILSIIPILSCTDVIDVEVPQGPTRLVIEASLDWEKGTAGNEQTIRLSKSTPYFDSNAFVPAEGAQVSVTNLSSSVTYIFTDQGDGEYRTSSFEPVMGQSYSLTIQYDGEIYNAFETMTPVTNIIDIYQSREDGFDDEALEAHILFNDPDEESNNYLFKFKRAGDLLPVLEAGDDKFINGNQIDWWYEIMEDEDQNVVPFEPGDILDINMYGISRPYYDYIKVMISQMGNSGPFTPVPAAVKGNCINRTNPENFPYGYFRLSEMVKERYIFTE